MQKVAYFRVMLYSVPRIKCNKRRLQRFVVTDHGGDWKQISQMSIPVIQNPGLMQMKVYRWFMIYSDAELFRSISPLFYSTCGHRDQI